MIFKSILKLFRYLFISMVIKIKKYILCVNVIYLPYIENIKKTLSILRRMLNIIREIIIAAVIPFYLTLILALILRTIILKKPFIIILKIASAYSDSWLEVGIVCCFLCLLIYNSLFNYNEKIISLTILESILAISTIRYFFKLKWGYFNNTLFLVCVNDIHRLSF